ncbi:MAG: phosphate ABC transporter permease subunit PstC [Armatimonadetes bacterium]|nr:phosphate ABC transporter permease subunit PstC [Armatimonadota bacterium]
MSAGEAVYVRPRPAFVLSDRVANSILAAGAASVVGLAVLLGVVLSLGAAPALSKFGAGFLVGKTWDPVAEHFGALPFIYGTLASSFLALLMAVPVGLGAAIFLAEVLPQWLARPIAFMIELLAAVPSVVYGMWGVFVAVPAIARVEEFIGQRWGHIPLFSGPPIGIGMLAAGVILAIMVLPFIASISREAILAVPRAQAEAALALGATKWETIRGPLLRYARKGILGGIVLALGRALGETMAVTMVIGNVPQISVSLFQSGYTMSAVLANEFAEATGRIHTAALVEIALVLLVLTVLVNAFARLLIWGTAAHAGEERV